MEELKVKYLTKSRNVVHSVRDQLSPVTQGLQDLQREVRVNQSIHSKLYQKNKASSIFKFFITSHFNYCDIRFVGNKILLAPLTLDHTSQ